MHGRWGHEASADGDDLLIGGVRIPLTRSNGHSFDRYPGACSQPCLILVVRQVDQALDYCCTLVDTGRFDLTSVVQRVNRHYTQSHIEAFPVTFST